MNLQLEGKTALVSGSSSGIGEAIAKTLAAEGARVAVHGRREAEIRRVAEAITGAGGTALVAIGDLATDEGARAVIDTVLRDLGSVDILINNAGAYKEQAWLETEPSFWTSLYEQNVVSMVRLIQGIVPGMKARGWGRIIQIASGVATLPLPGLAAYSASKAANVNLTVGLTKELAYTGITVNTISPGPILTPGLEAAFRDIAAKYQWGSEWSEIEARALKELVPNPSGRIGRVEDIAQMAAFLASPLAGYVNGANIRVDGGTVPTIN